MKSEPIQEGKIVESIKHTPQEFKERYEALCQETGYQVVVSPVYLKRDDGTYSTQIQTSVGQMPQPEA